MYVFVPSSLSNNKIKSHRESVLGRIKKIKTKGLKLHKDVRLSDICRMCDYEKFDGRTDGDTE